jgi:uncharacterized protein involved in outer membrane biogenesis
MLTQAGQNRLMKRLFKWISALVLGTLVLGAALAWGLQAWLATPQARAQLTQLGADAVGVCVSLGQIKVSAWPQPALQLGELVLQTQPPLAIKVLGLRSTWADILRGQLVLTSVEVQGVELSQPVVDALILLQQKKQLAQARQGLEVKKTDKPLQLPWRVVLDDVTWVGSAGKRSTLGGEVRLSDLGWLDEATLAVQRGSFAGTQIKLLRTDAQWTVDAKLGGGTVKGAVTWQSAPDKPALWVLGGQLQTRQVELAQLTPSPVLSGLLDADTTLSGRAKTLAEVLDVLQTQSHFTVREAVVHGIDLAKAVRTVGLSRGVQTPLDTLAGQVATRGRVIQLSQLVASSGALSVTGQVRVAQDTAVNGQLQVLLAEQALGSAVGVPLVVSGTLADPQVALTRSALLGAAIGTAILPGVGTGAGASLGDKLGSGINKLFGR